MYSVNLNQSHYFSDSRNLTKRLFTNLFKVEVYYTKYSVNLRELVPMTLPVFVTTKTLHTTIVILCRHM